MDEKNIKLRIYGMTCENCAITISESLVKQRGVKDVKISLSTGTGNIRIDPSEVAPESVLKNPIFSGKSHYKATIMEY
ncbi:MAG: heavy-metal-associated domain-containing protein [Thermoplasmatales archaeon]|nr:heavy-metal-associated domain-containing protein [Thermoplasmatales archaeon]MCW6170499.1 heavy-metal-associated domain-containing protein [Thermoplasmatales archaeon]